MRECMKRIKESCAWLAWMQFNPRACAWIAYIGLTVVSVSAILSIFLFFVPRGSSEWTRNSLLTVATIAGFAEVTGSLGLWGVLCQVSERVRQSDALRYTLGAVMVLVCLCLLYLHLWM
jgi:hypothetical protein